MSKIIDSPGTLTGRIAMASINSLSGIMDILERMIESSRVLSLTSNLLVIGFFMGLISVELNTHGMFPDYMAPYIPLKHLVIISQTFTVILCLEVVSLVFSFVHSVSISMGKQIEVVSLVLLRDVFKEFSNFSEPIEWVQVKSSLFPMISSAAGAFILFIILGFYYRVHQSRPFTHDANETKNFINIKKSISFLLLVSFIIIIGYETLIFFQTGSQNKAFETFYTILIFSDILIILVAMRYSSNYLVTFRNSGFAVATVFLRLALMSPPPYSALLGVGSALFVVGISIYYNKCTDLSSCEG